MEYTSSHTGPENFVLPLDDFWRLMLEDNWFDPFLIHSDPLLEADHYAVDTPLPPVQDEPESEGVSPLLLQLSTTASVTVAEGEDVTFQMSSSSPPPPPSPSAGPTSDIELSPVQGKRSRSLSLPREATPPKRSRKSDTALPTRRSYESSEEDASGDDAGSDEWTSDYEEHHDTSSFSLPQSESSRAFPCTHPGCGKAFTRNHDRTRHENLKHRAVASRLKCPFPRCTSTLARKDGLERHIKNAHPGLNKRQMKDLVRLALEEYRKRAAL